MSEEKSFTFPSTERLVFTYRESKDVPKEQAKKVTVLCNFSKLTPADWLEWAFSAMDVSFQSKLRAKTKPAVAINPETGKPYEDHDYEWTVPPRGTRTVASSLQKAASQVLDATAENPALKLQMFILMGVQRDLAVQMLQQQFPGWEEGKPYTKPAKEELPAPPDEVNLEESNEETESTEEEPQEEETTTETTDTEIS